MDSSYVAASFMVALGLGPKQYTDYARIAHQLAFEESARLFESFVDANHLVLGLVGAGGIMTDVFLARGLDVFTLRQLTREHMSGTGCKFTEPIFIGGSLIQRRAIKIAASFGHEHVNTAHLFLAVLEYGRNNPLIDLLHNSRDELTDLTRHALKTSPKVNETVDLDFEFRYSQISFTDFSDAAAEALLFAKDESRRLQHNFVCTEHLLLGLARAQGDAQTFFSRINVSLKRFRALVQEIDGVREGFVSIDAPYTLRSKRVLCKAQELRSDNEYVDTGAILEALVCVKDGVASLLLQQVLGNDYESKILSHWLKEASTETPRNTVGD